MGQKVVTSLVDDLDGSDADETVEFMLDGVRYAIDLSAENAHRLRAALAELVAAARRADGKRQARTSKPPDGRRVVDKLAYDDCVREFARRQGYKVGDRGRMPQSVVDEFRQWQQEQERKRAARRPRKAAPRKATKGKATPAKVSAGATVTAGAPVRRRTAPTRTRTAAEVPFSE